VLLGAVGGPKWADPLLRPEDGLLAIRKAMGVYANLRPGKVFPALANACALKNDRLANVDVMIVRELTGGLYYGARGEDETGAYDTERYSEQEVARVAHRACKLAQARGKKLCSVDKANVLASSRLWRRVVEEVHGQYEDVTLTHMYVDNAAMQLVLNPAQFDVILTSNLFGDILSDELAGVTGGIGLLPSASLGDRRALYEPVHGSAPELVGKNTANPVAAILSAAMMARHTFGDERAAAAIEQAVASAIEQGVRTPDIGGKSTTRDVGDAVVAAVSNRVKR